MIHFSHAILLTGLSFTQLIYFDMTYFEAQLIYCNVIHDSCIYMDLHPHVIFSPS